MILLIDIGNTNITIGSCDNGVRDVMRIGLVPERDMDAYSRLLKSFVLSHEPEKPKGAVICSVVDRAIPLLTKALKKSFGINPLNVNYKLKTGLKFCIKNPDKLGADRIVNAAAAYKLYKGHSIVIDFGTATTFSVVSSRGEYKGGAIMPGLGISAQVLSEKTARLPRVELKAPDKVLGDDTESNILSGLIIGHAGAVERIVKEMKLSLNKNKKAETYTNVIVTGGNADIVVPYIRCIKKINPFLTLEGLRIIYELNV